MTFFTCEGNYYKPGALADGDKIIFTFAGEREDDCAIALIHKKTKEETLIPVPEEYCKGSLRSICVWNIKAEDYAYLLVINKERVLDPYARVILGRETWMDFDRAKEDYALRGGFLHSDFDWKLDRAPEIKREDLILYKLHLRGFTMDKGAGKGVRGTFLGLIDKIPYLKELGVNAIECMPIYEFEEMTIPPKHVLPDYVKWQIKETDTIAPVEEEVSTKVNFWGYGPGNYFAVKASYAKDPGHAAEELKKLIQTLHRSGMEFIMEMYFPPHMDPNLVMEALRFWVLEYHVDGFHLLGEELPIPAIANDAVLSRTKIFYLGFEDRLYGMRKQENLFVYRDDYQYPAKKILNHMNSDMVEFIDQQKKQGLKFSYVNYVTGNNGFTLSDLFMYNDRHNEANGENNNDGNPWNFSNNQGIEGPSRKKNILAARKRQWRNAFLMLLTAQSVPLIWSGDEFENSQQGNNNPYCQDNEIGWVNWKNNQSTAEDIDFVKNAIAFRKEHPVIRAGKPFAFSDYKTKGAPDFSLHGASAWMTDRNPGNMAVGIMYCGAYSEDPERTEDVYVGYNFYSGRSGLALPKLSKGKNWYLVFDSADGKAPYHKDAILLSKQQTVELDPQSIVILIGK